MHYVRGTQTYLLCKLEQSPVVPSMLTLVHVLGAKSCIMRVLDPGPGGRWVEMKRRKMLLDSITEKDQINVLK